MDLNKLQKKYKITKKELNKEIKSQTDATINLLNKEIEDPLEQQRVMNLKDLQLRNMEVAGALNEDNKYYIMVAVYKAVVEQYWKEKDLPNHLRMIYTHSTTDAGLKKDQQKYLKYLKNKVSEYKKIITDWWKQREQEELLYKSKTTKPNGKGDHD
jgi:hypothetical protein|tara:strand:- start:1595 stop:2062 length:468 start_codon:yes stop_codon:yes gene_type:complete